jgi:hypothetical protein
MRARRWLCSAQATIMPARLPASSDGCAARTRAPFWKREKTASGTRWVDARETDEVASQRWSVGQRRSIIEKEH